jgi:hypothetical protein
MQLARDPARCRRAGLLLFGIYSDRTAWADSHPLGAGAAGSFYSSRTRVFEARILYSSREIEAFYDLESVYERVILF